MKKIGMIGGMSWESTKLYYAYINEMIKEQLGGSNSAEILLSSVNFQEIETLSFNGDWKSIGDLMSSHAKMLERAGADLIILCTNTIHLVKDRIEEAISIPFIHIADATGEAIHDEGLKTVGLLGTQFTMESDFYPKILKEHYGIKTVIPELSDRIVLQDIIYNELVKGIFLESSLKKCLEIIRNVQNTGAEGVILGCTELPLLLDKVPLDIPAFDTTRIHSRKAVDLSLA